MSLLGAAALLGTAWAIYKGGTIRDQEAYPEINDKEFDQECAVHGIMYKMNDEKIRKFAARWGVRYKDRQYKILPDIHPHQDYRIDTYIEGYALNNFEINDFYSWWNSYNDRMKEEKRKGIQKLNENVYKSIGEEEVKMGYTYEHVLEIIHWNDLEHDEVVERMEKIYNDTWIKQVTSRRPILRRRWNGWHETWVIKAQSKNWAKTYYEVCCEHFGWDPEI